MEVNIVRFKYVHMFGRGVASATLVTTAGEKEVFSGTLNSCLQFVNKNGLTVVNAQEILNRLVVVDNYAS